MEAEGSQSANVFWKAKRFEKGDKHASELQFLYEHAYEGELSTEEKKMADVRKLAGQDTGSS